MNNETEMAINIELTYSEIIQGSLVGIMRQVENLTKGRTPAYGSGKSNDWQLHIEGALGEMALAKHMKLYWSKGNLRDADVGDMEARTRSNHGYDLILHDNDNDESKYYLLTGTNGKYAIRGWILGKDGKKEKYWKDPAGGRPAFFIPAKELVNVLSE